MLGHAPRHRRNIGIVKAFRVSSAALPCSRQSSRRTAGAWDSAPSVTMRVSSSSSVVPPQSSYLLDERATVPVGGRHALARPLRARNRFRLASPKRLRGRYCALRASPQAGESRAVHQVVAESAPAPPSRGVVWVRHEVEGRGDARGVQRALSRTSTRRGCEMASASAGTPRACKSGCDVARPHAVRYRPRRSAARAFLRRRLRPPCAPPVRTRLGRVVCQSNLFDGIGASASRCSQAASGCVSEESRRFRRRRGTNRMSRCRFPRRPPR